MLELRSAGEVGLSRLGSWVVSWPVGSALLVGAGTGPGWWVSP